MSLLRKQFLRKNDAEFQEHVFNLQNSFYKITSIFILISAYLYGLNEKIPFLLQATSFLVSFYYLKKIPERYISNQKSATKNPISSSDIAKSLKFCHKDHTYLFLIICSALFSLGLSINQKLI